MTAALTKEEEDAARYQACPRAWVDELARREMERQRDERREDDLRGVHIDNAGGDGKKKRAKEKSVRKEELPQREFRLLKADEEQRLVFGFFTIPEVKGELVLDKEGEALDPADLEKAAYEFNLNARVAGERHTRMNVGRLVESAVLTVEKQQAMQKMLIDLGIKDAVIDLQCSAWWGGFKVDDDDVWAKVQKGDYPAFSIGGSATREDVTKGDRDVPRGMGSMIASRGENADVLIAF